MSVFKCKMCGGAMEVQPNATVVQCEYCGVQQTLPRLDDDRRAKLYDRANHFRRSNEFDKAMAIYEKILEEDNTDPEIYWSLVLCRYGIEYVEDPNDGKRVPTVHRTQFTSIFEDEDYKSALSRADAVQRRLYEQEAAAINEIQKGILAISQKEEPFDVFICYKETDETGRRTHDSVLANELYHQLTQEGFKVFFSRITLEDKLGTAYEPYIFAALNSAKVMVVIGTKPQYFNAVWVKNEWSRYLSLIKKGQKKALIPAYKDMDPYDLPEEFSLLQGQDMSKLGFMQDLIRGIKKITQADAPQPTVVQEKVVVSGGNSKIDALLDRGNMALEDGEWDKATDFFEEVLNNDSKNAQAYLGEAMAQEECVSLEAFVQKRLIATETAKEEEWYFAPQESHIKEIIEKYYIPNYVDLGKLKSLYSFKTSYTATLTCRKEQLEKEEAYWNGHKLLSRAERFAEGELKAYIETQKQTLFGTLTKRMKEAEEKKEADRDRTYEAHTRRLQEADSKAKAMYDAACRKREEDYQGLKKTAETSDDPGALLQTASKLKELKDYKDSPALVGHCETRAAEIRAQQKAEAQRLRLEEEKKKKRIVLIACAALVLAIAAIIIVTTVIIPNNKYNDALSLMNSGKYEEAITAFEELKGHKDSKEKITACETAIKDIAYDAAVALMNSGKYEEAITAFEELKEYKDSKEKISACETAIKDIAYDAAVALMNSGKYEEAITAFEELKGHKDSKEKISACETAIKDIAYDAAIALMNNGKYEEAINAFEALDGYKDSAEKIVKIKIDRMGQVKVGDYVYYGTYPQTKAGTNSTEIEWLVLAKEGDKVLLLSRYELDAQPYNTDRMYVTWETCSLRKWLNNDFLNKAFTAEEQKAIATTNVSNAKNQGYKEWDTNGGNDTQDKIFLLSYNEANKYLGVTYDNSNNTKARVAPTEYAIAQGAYANSSYTTAEGKAAGTWWLRSPGFYQDYAALVYCDGSLIYGDVIGGSRCVRPAFWLNLES